VPRRVDDDCLQELRWFYDRRELVEVRRDIAQWLAKWEAKYPKLCLWVGDNIEETLTYYRLPPPHHKHMKSTNMLERLNQELKRRTPRGADLPKRRELPQAGACAGGCPRPVTTRTPRLASGEAGEPRPSPR
jgi:transposase-like protein